MKKFNISLYTSISLVLIFSIGIGIAYSGNSAMYKVTIQNLTNGQPLSPPVAATHKNKINMFSVGALASLGQEAIAEDGNQSLMFNRFQNLVNEGEDATDAVDVGAPVLLGGAQTFSIEAAKGDKFSLSTMLICTNDGFTGLDRVRLPEKGAKIYLPNGYDAGTEMNTEMSEDIVDACSAIGPVVLAGDPNGNENDAVDMMPRVPIMHHPNIGGGGDLFVTDHGWSDPVAKVTITRINGEAHKFLSRLSGAGEVPIVDNDALGRAKFDLNHDESMLRFSLNVFDIEGVTQAHIHMGMPNMNGPVVAFLFGPVAPTGDIEGHLARGTITEGDLIGPLAGDFEAFVDAMRNGMLYVNVHTNANPTGEIRGQIGAYE